MYSVCTYACTVYVLVHNMCMYMYKYKYTLCMYLHNNIVIILYSMLELELGYVMYKA